MKLNGSTILIQYWNWQNLWCCYDKLMLSLCYLSLERKVVCSGKEDWGQGYYQLLQLLTTNISTTAASLSSPSYSIKCQLCTIKGQRTIMIFLIEKNPDFLIINLFIVDCQSGLCLSLFFPICSIFLMIICLSQYNWF